MTTKRAAHQRRACACGAQEVITAHSQANRPATSRAHCQPNTSAQVSAQVPQRNYYLHVDGGLLHMLKSKPFGKFENF